MAVSEAEVSGMLRFLGYDDIPLALYLFGNAEVLGDPLFELQGFSFDAARFVAEYSKAFAKPLKRHLSCVKLRRKMVDHRGECVVFGVWMVC